MLACEAPSAVQARLDDLRKCVKAEFGYTIVETLHTVSNVATFENGLRKCTKTVFENSTPGTFHTISDVVIKLASVRNENGSHQQPSGPT